MQTVTGHRTWCPRHETGWDCLKIRIMQKNQIKKERKKRRRRNNDYYYKDMKWSCFYVQYYKGLKAVWCYHVFNFLCLVFETPHQEIALYSPNHYKLKNEFKKKEGKVLNTPCQCCIFVFFYLLWRFLFLSSLIIFAN